MNDKSAQQRATDEAHRLDESAVKVMKLEHLTNEQRTALMSDLRRVVEFYAPTKSPSVRKAIIADMVEAIDCLGEWTSKRDKLAHIIANVESMEKSSLRSIKSALGWLADRAKDVERDAAGAFTPGNTAKDAAVLECERYRLVTVTEILKMLRSL